MAGRVNVKFVVILSVILVAVAAGVGTLAALVIFKSGDDLARLGDAKMAEGDYAAAENFYSRAVNHDPYNAEWLRKWRSALEQWVPATQREFENEYHVNYRMLHRQLALSDLDDTEAQRDYLELLYRQLMFGRYNRQGYETLAAEAETFIKYHQSRRPDDLSWQWLRRYRAIPVVRRMAAGGLPPDDQVQTARIDLDAAIASDPDDYDSAEGLVILALEDARRSRDGGRPDLAVQHEAAALAVLDEFLEHAGAGSMARLSGLALRTQVRIAADRHARAPGRNAQGVAPEHVAEAEATFEEADRVDPSTLDTWTLDRLRRLELAVTPATRGARTLSLVNAALASRPKDASLLSLKAELLGGQEALEEAIETYAQILDQPNKPVSFDGYVLMARKIDAVHAQANLCLRGADTAADAAGREAWMARARDRRSAFAMQVPDDTPLLMMIDGKMRIIERDFVGAQAVLQRYNDATGSGDPEGLWLAAVAARELNQPGVVKQRLERLLELAPDAPNALLLLADVEADLRNYERALELYRRYLAQTPENAAVAERITAIEKQIGIVGTDDPVEAALIQAVRLYEGSATEPADPAAALGVLSAAVDRHGPHPRLSIELARLRVETGDLAGARAAVEASLRDSPEDEPLRRLAEALTADNPVDVFASLIEQSDRPEERKRIARYQLYMSHGETEKAEAEILRAAAIAPEDPVVVDVLFMRAVSANNTGEARRLAEIATRINADRVDGLTFRARLEAVEGRGDAAVATLTEATRRDPMNAGVWRLLARQQLALGRGQAALAAYTRALEIRPNDVPVILEHLRVLVQMERLNEALDAARRVEAYARGNEEFVEILLDLEAAVGNRSVAMERRERVFLQRPEDRRNRQALAGLYIDAGRWEEAKTLLDGLRADGDDRSLVSLVARWHADQGNVEAARRAFVDFIVGLPPEDRLEGYLALGQFMMQRGQTETALRAFEQAREHQSPGELEADKALANSLLLTGRADAAADVYKRVVDGGADTDGTYRKRLAESLTRARRYEEAEVAIASIPDAESDYQVVLLRSEVLLGRDQASQARQLLERAVSRWPDEPMIYLKRAQALALEPALRRDALADLDRALQLRPDFWQAMRVRAQLLMQLDRVDDALRDLRESIRVNPALDELRSALIAELLRLKRVDEAMGVAEEAFRARPNDLPLRVGAAEQFVRAGAMPQAAQIYRAALARSGETVIAQRLLEVLLAQQPPSLSEAEQVLAEHRALVEGDPGLLLARARVYAERGQLTGARRDALRSLTLLERQPDLMVTWYSNVRNIFKSDSDLLAFLDEVARQPGLLDWATLFRARAVLGEPRQTPEGLRLLDALLARNPETPLKFAALRAKAGVMYDAGRYEEALAAWNQALEMDPGNWQLKNNIAFTLAKHLNRAAEALPFAQEAVRTADGNPDVMDTLGLTLLALGRAEDAARVLEQAREYARGTPAMAAVSIHLATAKLDLGDKAGARELVRELQAALEQGLSLNDQYTRELQDLVEWVKE